MDNNFTPADYAAMNGGFGGGNQEWLWIILFFLFAGGGNGFGGNRKDCATTEDVQNQFNFAALERQNGETVAAVANNTNAVTNAVKDSEIRLQQGIGALAGMEQNIIGNTSRCCCETLRGIDGVNYNAAMNTAAINANTTAQAQKILDAITGNRMADMQNQINQLQLQSQLCGVVRYPTNTTYSVNSPCFCGNGFNGNGGCGCGCGY